MQDNYIHRAFLDAPRTILGGIVLFIGGVLIGEGIFTIAQNCLGSGLGSHDPFDFLFELLLAYGCGAMLGVGLIFIGIDFWFIYRLMYKEESMHTFFFVVAANQVALALCPSVLQGVFLQALPGGIIATLVLWILYWGSKKLRTKIIGM